MILKSLRSQLLVWLLVPLCVVAALDAWIAYKSGMATATLVQERILLGSARTIAEQIGISDGRYVVSIPPSSIEMLDDGHADHVYFRVTAPDGELLAGYGELPRPDREVDPENWIGFDTTMHGQDAHVVAFAQPVLGAPSTLPVTIEVAQTMTSRNALAREIWLHAVREQTLMLLLVAGLLIIGLRGGLKPLIALRDHMQHRAPLSLESVTIDSVPSELRSTISAFNAYASRLARHMQLHSRFIADASHQLRTPLAVLNLQIAFALRQDEPDTTREVLEAIRGSVQTNIRLVNQLLSFTEAESAQSPALDRRCIDLCAVVCTIIEELATLAQSRSIDLGFETTCAGVVVDANEHLVHMLIGNLVDNALRYTQTGGIVTIGISVAPDRGAVLAVVDNGPGIPAVERNRVFERFYRLPGSHVEGCGLGLSIVREAVAHCDASIDLSDSSATGGLMARVRFPPPRTSDRLSATSTFVPVTATYP